jgi:hypothetical protein
MDVAMFTPGEELVPGLQAVGRVPRRTLLATPGIAKERSLNILNGKRHSIYKEVLGLLLYSCGRRSKKKRESEFAIFKSS